MKTQLLSLILLTSFISLAQQPYYNDVNLTLNGTALRDELASKITDTHVNFLSYTPGIWEASKSTDFDPNDPTNVFLIYGYEDGTDGDVTNDLKRNIEATGGANDGSDWNREHVYARSLGTPNLGLEGPGADAHHLRPSDVQRNSSRGNRKFADGNGTSGITAQGNWYPGDQWKGDVARMIMYMYLRYGSRALPSNVTVGTANSSDNNMIDVLLEWNAEDPVSRIEINRNNYHNSTEQYAQGNRNPFIDNPNLATQIWGGTAAEDRWNSTSSDTEAPTAPTNLNAITITSDNAIISWTASTDNIEVVRYDIFLDGTYINSSQTPSIEVSGLQPETQYDLQIFATDLAGNTSTGSTVLQFTTIVAPNFLINENFNSCSTVTPQFTAISELSNLDWECSTGVGENGTDAYRMNAFSAGSTVASVDWLITTNPINFDNTSNELLSLYTLSEFGNTELQLIYSTNYDGSANPSNFTWIPVPNITIPTHPDGSGTDDINSFTNIDISGISGTVYFGFKYDTNGGNATRWTVDNFQITGDNILSNLDILEDPFSVYPNPSFGTVFINVNHIPENVELRVFDSTGKLILITNIDKTSKHVMLPYLPKGMLFLELTSSKKKITKKIIVQ